MWILEIVKYIMLEIQLNKTNNMKKLIFLLSIVLLTSCGYDVPKLNESKDPFIVDEIKSLGEYCLYYSTFGRGSLEETLFSETTCICLPKGYYNIGDTITLIPTHHE